MLPYIALLTWCGILYFRAIDHPFVYDDQFQITRNLNIQHLETALGYFLHGVDFQTDFTGATPSQFYRPAFWLSLWADYGIWGPNAAGFHVTNILLHAFNAILIAVLARQLLGDTAAFFIGLTWVSLPIHTEVVAWISGRGLSLATAFILLTVIQAIKYAEDRKSIRLWFIGLTCLGALLSHEGGIVAPALALFTAAVRSPSNTQRRTLQVMLVGTGIPVVAYILVRALFLNLAPPAPSTFRDILLRTPVSFAKYLWWTIHAPGMSVERSTELINVHFASPVYAFAWVTLIIVGVVALFSPAPLMTCTVLATFITLLPFSQILPLYQSMAERYTYTASIGVLLTVTALLFAVQTRFRLPRWTPIAFLCVWIALSVVPLERRIQAWSSEESLFSISLRATPGSHVLYHNLAVVEENAGRSDLAFSLFKKSIELKPDYFTGRKDLANFYLRQRDFSQAERAYKEFLQYYPGDRETRLNLANVQLIRGDSESAIALLRKLVSEDPNFFEAQIDLGAALLGKNDAEARLHLETALRIRPDSAEAAYNLGFLEEQNGHPDEARRLYRETLFYRPDHQKAAQRLRELETGRSGVVH